MTEKEFNKKFHGVIGPIYRGASYPAFCPTGINEKNFSDDLRIKWLDISFKTDDNGNINTISIEWESQLWDEYGVNGVKKEICRCFKHIGYNGKVQLYIYDRDGEGSKKSTFTLK